MGASASWACLVFELASGRYYLAGFRTGVVTHSEDQCFFLCSQKMTNNTGELEAFGHALGWARSLGDEEGEILFVADSAYAIRASQALQRCSSNGRLVHAVRRIWRRLATRRHIRATHGKGHCGDPWNKFVDVVVDAAQSGLQFLRVGYEQAP